MVQTIGMFAGTNSRDAFMIPELSIISDRLLDDYCSQLQVDLPAKFAALHDAELSTSTFSFYTSVASIYSSRIEGEVVELDSYIKHKRDGVLFQPDYTQKIDDLYEAYSFAKENALHEENIRKAHQLLSRNILSKQLQGTLRTGNMYVSTPDGRIEYVAASPYKVKAEMEKFYADLSLLIETDLPVESVFYFASMIHLLFVKIHPWNDGNGRCARLIEKWFLAQKLGEKAWFLSSEKHYYAEHTTYYANIRKLGLEYQELDYDQALPFLLMLSQAL
ncbi:MAG: Fic family protein [Bacteroidota bacterium]